MSQLDNNSQATKRFELAAVGGRVNKEQVISILQSLNYTEQGIKTIVSNIEGDVDFEQFSKLLKNNDQEKLTSNQISQIYEDFKQAIKLSNLEKVQHLLIKYQSKVDLVNRIDPQTRQISTYIAVQSVDDQYGFQILKLLIENGADLNFKDSLKQSIFYFVCRDGKLDMFEYLISKGAQVNDTDANGQGPLFYAARDNKIEIIKRLISLGGNVNQVDSLYGQTALFYAAREGHVEVCKLLVEAGCKVSHYDTQKKQALYYARKFRRFPVIDYLQQSLQEQKEKHHKKDDNQKQDSKSFQRRRHISNQKFQYKLIFIDEKGEQKEVTKEDFIKFQIQFPDVAKMITNPDEYIDESMITQVREEETWEKLAKKLLAILWKEPYAELFHAPVDPEIYGIYDYYDVIKEPMDFGTIKRKLTHYQYKSFREFHNDILLVFENCIKYNGANSEVGGVGVRFKQEYIILMDQHGASKYL